MVIILTNDDDNIFTATDCVTLLQQDFANGSRRLVLLLEG